MANENRDGCNTKALNDKKVVAAVIDMTKSHRRIAIGKEEFDSDNWLLNTPGGVIDLYTGAIRPARREDYFTKITKVAPAVMDTPIFDRFIRDIMGAQIPPSLCECAACIKVAPPKRTAEAHLDEIEKLVGYLMRRYGYALSGDTKKHGLVVELGDGGNGKGVLNDLFSQDIWGTCPDGYATDIAVEALLNRKGFEAHPTELIDLFHARLVLAREANSPDQVERRPDRNGSLAATALRRAGCGRTLSNSMPRTTFFIFGNNKPILPGSDQNAWKRRLDLVMFPADLCAAADPSRCILKEDEHLRDKLRAEAPGVLQKLIDACIECSQMTGFDPPDTVMQASDNYLSEQNFILQWLDSNCDRRNPWSTETASNLFTDFVKWAMKQQIEPCNRNAFNDKLRKTARRPYRHQPPRSQGYLQGDRLETRRLRTGGTTAGSNPTTRDYRRP